jgi:hypothetical protein
MISTSMARLPAYVLIVLGAMATALYLGKDHSWDSLAYHLYAGFSAMESRLSLDYFASSTQGYLNPYSHLPFYLLVTSGLAPQAVVATLALFHALNLLIVYELALLLNRRQNGSIVWTPVILALFFAFFNPVFLQELGTSFNEISTSVPVLAGWYLLIRAFAAPSSKRLVVAGLLIGAAVALKLSNLYFSVTALPLLLLAPASWKARGTRLLLFACGGLLGAILAGGWWAWQMWDMFGNPFFPMFNQFFHAPAFTDGPIKHYRFVSNSFADLVLKPFWMTLPKRGIHTEPVAPDLRYAALVLLLCLFCLKYSLGRSALGKKWLDADPFPAFQQQRALGALTVALLLAWSVWAVSSGNSRYFLAMSSVTSVVLASLLFRFSAKRRVLVYSVVALAGLQGAVMMSAEYRWGAAGWGNSWFELDIPPELQREATLYLHVGIQPASFLLPYLPQGSSMINLTGQYVLEPTGRTRALIEKHRGHVRVLQRFRADIPPDPKEFNVALIRHGLEVDMEACQTIGYLQRKPEGDIRQNYVACKTRPLQWSAARLEDYEASRRRADAVFDALERLCPRYFQPRGLATEGDGKAFWRSYPNTDMILRKFGTGRVSFENAFTLVEHSGIGNIAELEKALPDKVTVCPGT